MGIGVIICYFIGAFISVKQILFRTQNKCDTTVICPAQQASDANVQNIGQVWTAPLP